MNILMAVAVVISLCFSGMNKCIFGCKIKHLQKEIDALKPKPKVEGPQSVEAPQNTKGCNGPHG